MSTMTPSPGGGPRLELAAAASVASASPQELRARGIAPALVSAAVESAFAEVPEGERALEGGPAPAPGPPPDPAGPRGGPTARLSPPPRLPRERGAPPPSPRCWGPAAAPAVT